MLIGRKNEQQTLLDALKSDESEFIAVYGRRRVGKTYLIRETFNYHFAFEHSGLLDAPLAEQLEEFMESLYSAACRRVNARSRGGRLSAFCRGCLRRTRAVKRKLSSLTSCRGWTRLVPILSVRSIISGTAGRQGGRI